MQILRSTLFLLLYLLLILPAPQVLAFDKTNMSYFGGLALGGYDAVSYFTESKAVKGSKTYSVDWKDATWLFSSDTNRQRFVDSPEAFAPQYGGYC
jgi:hypothetical protein